MKHKTNQINKISPFTIDRLSLYLRFLRRLKSQGIANIFSHQLAQNLSFTAHVIRKDLSQFGQFGNISTGYNIDELITSLSKILGVERKQDVVLIGVGNLGRALLGFKGFGEHGFQVSAVFDVDDSKTNRVIGGIRCFPMSDLENYINENNIKIAILAVPAKAAQGVVDNIVKLGIRGILNFAPVMLKAPESVKLFDVDFVSKLEALSYYVKNSDRSDSK